MAITEVFGEFRTGNLLINESIKRIHILNSIYYIR